MPTTVFFDLDGTLVDSAPGIYAGVSYALTALGYPTPSSEVSSAFIGPPLYGCFRDLFGLDETTARQAVTLYREYYGERGLYESTVYDGISTLLDHLSAAGYRLCLATGKPWPYAARILAHFGLDRYFFAVFGAEFDGTRGEKQDLLAYALKATGTRPSEAVMVGDRRFDIEGALAVGITPLGVLWGYGDEGELSAAGTPYLVATPSDLFDIIVSLA